MTDDSGATWQEEVIDETLAADDEGYWWTNDQSNLTDGLLVGNVSVEPAGTT